MSDISDILNMGAFTRQQVVALAKLMQLTSGGASAYEIAVAAGFVGTEAAWLTSLHGAPGTNGTNGADGGGTVVALGADAVITATSMTDVGLAFTPVASSLYAFEAFLEANYTSATNGAGPKLGFTWPTGLTMGGARSEVPSFGGITRVQTAAAGTALTGGTNSQWPVANTAELMMVRGFLRTGTSPSGDFKLTAMCNAASQTLTIYSGSILRYFKLG